MHNNHNVTCAHCGMDIPAHMEIHLINCLSALSGEIEVLRQATKRRES